MELFSLFILLIFLTFYLTMCYIHGKGEEVDDEEEEEEEVDDGGTDDGTGGTGSGEGEEVDDEEEEEGGSDGGGTDNGTGGDGFVTRSSSEIRKSDKKGAYQCYNDNINDPCYENCPYMCTSTNGAYNDSVRNFTVIA